ncbi:glycosyltransferase [Phytoactinopolyspora mesophila]|uniref:Glycosyltransferase n=1 Tax=Phytoactinopolyspora mesophila TaxID=2650750 RepID=A0A7K3M8P6_9ACTN|nr:glycosyltransferase family 2 protein [Phytoactinopolyspora mesophila]NDL59654.1 glycosyltransferase [Phytoactinopolyspora mesophila]
MEVPFLFLVVGVNLALWSVVGLVRYGTERWITWPVRGDHEGGAEAGTDPAEKDEGRLKPADVAVLIPAHNEEPVIAASIESALRLVPAGNIHVVADGCADATAEIARAAGVQVLELNPGRGKAGGIEAVVERFDLPGRFEVLLIVDADTVLDQNYLKRGLVMLDEPGVVALAGYAKASWRPQELSAMGRFLVSHRTRVYAVMQWLKYGQTWRWTNVTSIVPGFASMYRTRVLRGMDLNPPGLVIEDFNMTFEIHRKGLGKIAFRPGVNATTQDPDNFRDYYRQVSRWFLGFWQTVRRHGYWRSWFSAALLLFLAEVLVASIALVLLTGVMTAWALTTFAVNAGVTWAWLLEAHAGFDASIGWTTLLLFLFLPDYLLTCVTAIAVRRPSLLLYGLGFLVLKAVDASAVLRTLPQAWSTRSSGQWKSPARRPVASAGDADVQSRRVIGGVPPDAGPPSSPDGAGPQP